MNYLLHIGTMACIYGMLALSLDLVAGHAGLISLAHAGFFGLGAYSAALLSTNFDLSFTLVTASAVASCVVVSTLVAFASCRLREDYFVISTFALQIAILSILTNWRSLTRGPLGIPGIPPPTLFGYHVNTPTRDAALTFLCYLLVIFLVNRITRSPLGRVLHAIREDELLPQSLGKNTVKFKLLAYGVSAAAAALAGVLYAYHITYIDPSSFTVTESILILSMVVIGGAGTTSGPIVGASILVALPEALRFLGLPIEAAANIREILYGTMLVLMLLVRPRGLVGRYGFGR